MPVQEWRFVMILDDLAAATRARVEKKKNEVSFEAVKKQAMSVLFVK